jgi:hypothetical protein
LALNDSHIELNPGRAELKSFGEAPEGVFRFVSRGSAMSQADRRGSHWLTILFKEQGTKAESLLTEVYSIDYLSHNY